MDANVIEYCECTCMNCSGCTGTIIEEDISGALIGRKEVNIKFVLNTLEKADPNSSGFVRTSQEIWKGEMELPDGVLVMKVSVIAEGQPHPICDVPFSLTEGYWRWMPPESEYGEDVERVGGSAYDDKGRRIQT